VIAQKTVWAQHRWTTIPGWQIARGAPLSRSIGRLIMDASSAVDPHGGRAVRVETGPRRDPPAMFTKKV